eukprot:GEMP01027465.1.p1 GENE.GEMP01027465.1~~GEMP01027465.1.p1  ORF type:complete len:644 (+),score=153.85 GEMP01027465.1:134-2065(+)
MMAKRHAFYAPKLNYVTGETQVAPPPEHWQWYFITVNGRQRLFMQRDPRDKRRQNTSTNGREAVVQEVVAHDAQSGVPQAQSCVSKHDHRVAAKRASRVIMKPPLPRKLGSTNSRAGKQMTQVFCSLMSSEDPDSTHDKAPSNWHRADRVIQKIRRARHSRLNHTSAASKDERLDTDQGASRSALVFEWGEDRVRPYFCRYSDENGSGLLEKHYISDCLADLGLRCCFEEKKFLRIIIYKLPDAITLRDFCEDVVDPMRLSMLNAKHQQLEAIFRARGTDDNEQADKKAAQELLQEVALAPRGESENKVVNELLESVFHTRPIFYSDVEVLALEVTQQVTALRRVSEWEMKDHLQLTLHQFVKSRNDFIILGPAFRKHASDRPTLKKGLVIPEANVDQFLMEIGNNFRPGDILPHFDGTLSFAEAYQAMQNARTAFLRGYRENILDLFNAYDADRSNSISRKEVSLLLIDLDLAPSNKEEQEDIDFLLSSADADHNGEYSLEEFITLCGMVTERVNTRLFKAQLDMAMAVGFDEPTFVSLRTILYKFEDANCGYLKTDDACRVIRIARKRMPLYACLKGDAAADSLVASALKQSKQSGGIMMFAEFLVLMSRLAKNAIEADIRLEELTASEAFAEVKEAHKNS